MEAYQHTGAGGTPATGERKNNAVILRRKPPYSNSLALPAPNSCLVICTGSGAWERGRSPFFYPRWKVVLPFGDDPARYDWRIAAGVEAIIFPSGEYEPVDVIARLGGLLLAAGACLVVYCPEPGKGCITRIDAARRATA